MYKISKGTLIATVILLAHPIMEKREYLYNSRVQFGI